MATGFITQQSDRSTPGSQAQSVVADTIWGEKFTSPAGGAGAWKVTELGVYCDNSGAGGGAGTFQMAIYDVDGSGDLDNLMGSTGASSEQDPGAVGGWVAFTGLSIIIDGSTTYALVVWPDDANFDFEQVEKSGNSNSERNDTHGNTAWNWPDLAGVSDNVQIELGIYAVYESAEDETLPIIQYYYQKRRSS